MFYPQIEDQCGPASLATMLNHRGIAVSAESLRGKIYIPGKEGTLTTEVIARTRQYGLLPYVLSPELSDILREVAAGNPVLVLQNLSLDWYPRWHFSIVTGYDLDGELLILRSGDERALETPMGLFLKTWERADRWAVVMDSPDRIPTTAVKPKFIQSALALELVGKTRAANEAYITAVTRWPESEAAWFGAGNTAYQLGEFDPATRFYMALLDLDPESGPTWNNLAHSLAQLGCGEEALRAIGCALAIDPDHDEFLDSERELRTGPVKTSDEACPNTECPHRPPA